MRMEDINILGREKDEDNEIYINISALVVGHIVTGIKLYDNNLYDGERGYWVYLPDVCYLDLNFDERMSFKEKIKEKYRKYLLYGNEPIASMIKDSLKNKFYGIGEQ